MSLFPIQQHGLRRTTTIVLGEVRETQQPFTFRGTVQPMTAHDIAQRPGGRFDMGGVKVYTAENLVVGREGVAQAGDLIEFDGDKYELVSKDPYRSGLIPHNKYFGVLWQGEQ